MKGISMGESVEHFENQPPVPAGLLLDHLGLLTQTGLPGPVLDLACGDGHNGLFLATKGLPVICCDRSSTGLQQARQLALALGLHVEIRQVDLEPADAGNPLPEDRYGVIMAFRNLHRPLIPCIRKAVKQRGLVLYETFTVDQPKFGRPHNPDFLLQPGELFNWFRDWKVIHYFEGIKRHPRRAVAQIVCQKPGE
jgi:tellurite methyltransferase